MRGHIARLAAAVVASIAGLTLGHALVYGLVAEATHPTTAALTAAGHEHWLLPWEALPVVLLLAIGLHVLSTRGRRAATPVRALLGPLVALQSGGFLAVETVERAVVLGAAAAAPAEPVMLVGLVIQAAIAALIAAVLVTGARITTPAARPRRRARPDDAHGTVPRALADVLPAVRPGRQSISFRGPPVLTGP